VTAWSKHSSGNVTTVQLPGRHKVQEGQQGTYVSGSPELSVEDQQSLGVGWSKNIREVANEQEQWGFARGNLAAADQG